MVKISPPVLMLRDQSQRIDLTTSDGVGSGFGDVAIGVKQQLGSAQGFDVSVILFLCLPTGGNTVSSGGYDPGLQVPWSRGLSANWTAAGMFSVYWPTQARTPKRDRRVYVSARSAIDEALGCVCRVRGRLSGDRSAATLATFWNSFKDHQAATD